jgi:alpha-glucosidase
MRKLVAIAALLSLLAACHPVMEVSSPDGRILVQADVDSDGQPLYAVEVDGLPLIGWSQLGLVAEGIDLSAGFRLLSSKVSQCDSLWHQPWGENKEIRDAHRTLMLRLQNEADVRLDIEFRVFDDGLGFRYTYEVPALDSLTVCDEKTSFVFADDATSWSIPGDINSYEHLYRKMPLSQLKDANTPLTLRFSDTRYASVHEAAIVDFPEMVLRRVDSTTLQAALASEASVPQRFATPWRTVQIARNAVGLVNSSLILNLNEPCALADVSWIKPMKYVGVWWGMHLGIESWGGAHHGATTETALRYIDFAAANNIQGVLFEGWNDAWRGSDALPDFDFTRAAPDFDVERVVAYAREKGIEYISHNETGGNFRRFEAQLDRSLDWAQTLGIHALKTGYAGGGLYGGIARHSQTGVRHFQKVIEEAAKRQIMVDAHEVIKPSGLRRTWPNFMTRECARGMEYNGWSAGNPPAHHEILPYTRLLAGPMDYTPGVFDVLYRQIQGLPQVRSWGQPGTECRVNTTLAKQIANWVVLYSPMQMACDLLDNYEGHPAFQFFRDFDADCDASEALQGEVGEYIAVVRRAGDRFFYGATTDETPRTLTQPLSFLRPGVTYTATLYADAPDADWQTNPYAYVIEQRTVTSNDTLTLPLAASGGCAISFLPL